MRLNGTLYSKTLGMDTGISVVTPNAPLKKGGYKLAYLLHGICGDNRTWPDYSMLTTYAANAGTVYVMPDASRSFYTDMKHGQRWFTYITEELPALVKDVFNVSASREDTAVIGCSMGAFGALKCALTHPESYGMCAAFSSCCLFLKEAEADIRERGYDSAFINAFGERIAEDFLLAYGGRGDFALRQNDDIPALLKKVSALSDRPRLYITCGSDDPFYGDHLRLRDELLRDYGGSEFDSWKAGHDFAYFDEALRRAIEKFEL